MMLSLEQRLDKIEEVTVDWVPLTFGQQPEAYW